MKRYLSLLLLALCLALPVQAREAREQQKIEYLISAIGGLHGAVFIRNGKQYDAAKAAAHLREKLDYAGEKIRTANDFIDKCATASWLSKRKYLIRFKDGHTLEAATFLRGKLKEYEALKAQVSH